MELLKLLSASEIIAQVIIFFLLLFLLRVFAWKKILKLLDERNARLRAEFKYIEDTKQELSSLKAGYELRLGSIEDIAKKKIQEAISDGRKITEEIRKKAHEDAHDIIENARADIKYELSKAKEELKDEVIDLTIKTAESVIQEKLNEAGDRRLVKDFLDKIEQIE